MTTRRAVAVSMTLAVVMVVSGFSSPLWAAEGNATFGGQWWDQTVRDAKFQEFRVVPRGSLMESFLLREQSGRNSLALWGANAFQGDQANKLTLANGVRWRADLGYTQIPHLFSHLARWGWTQTAPGVFSIPDTLQARNQGVAGAPAATISSEYTKRMQDFLRSAPVVGLGFNTDISTARLRARPAKGLQLEARGAVRER